jgi:hypothetical protein
VPSSSLEIKYGSNAGELFRLLQERTVIGRHPACDIVLDASAVSRQHAAVTVVGHTAFIEDLRSRNGATVNGSSFEEVLPRLLDGLFGIFPQAERGFVLGRPLRARPWTTSSAPSASAG